MTRIPLGILSSQQPAAPAVSYYLSTFTGADRVYGFNGAVSEDYNLYVVGDERSTGTSEAWIAKLDASGVVQWKNRLGGVNVDRYDAALALSNNEIIAAGQTTTQGFSNNNSLIAKYDSSGSVVWHRVLTGYYFERTNSLASDSLGNIYAAGIENPSGTYTGHIYKVDSSGNLLWQKGLSVSPQETFFNAVTVDNSDNVYTVGYRTGLWGIISKWDTTGNLVWDRQLTPTTNNEIQLEGVTTDSAGNIYAVGYNEKASGYDEMLIVKFDSSGSLLWQRVLGNAYNCRGYGIAVDSNEDIVVGGYNDDPTVARNFLIAKYDSSGTIQWQREIGASGSEQFYQLRVDNADNIYAIGSTTSTTTYTDTLIAVIPPDGSLTGTYLLDGVVFTYQAASMTDSAGSVNTSAGSGSAVTSTHAWQTGVLAESVAPLTEYITYL